MAATPLIQLYSQNHWLSDGSDAIWNFTFADGYLNRAFVKAYYKDPDDNITDIPVTDGMFTGDFQLSVTPNVPAGYTFVIYRDTPKDAPLVNFADGARVSEVSLDRIARQACHIAAEVLDGSGQTIVSAELGFKALKRVIYSGTSTVLPVDLGKAHFKSDATGVIIPNTLPSDFLVTVMNHNDNEMQITFTDGGARMQGADDTDLYSFFALAGHNLASCWKVAPGEWVISGLVEPN
jgi:Phage T7 tail fibre protein